LCEQANTDEIAEPRYDYLVFVGKPHRLSVSSKIPIDHPLGTRQTKMTTHELTSMPAVQSNVGKGLEMTEYDEQRQPHRAIMDDTEVSTCLLPQAS